MPIPLVALLVIVVFAIIAVALGASASMIGYGLLKTTAKFNAFTTIDIPNAAIVPPAGTWAFQYSPNMPQQMWKNADGTYYFDFPSKDGVHYVVQKAPKVAFGKTITMNFNIGGAGELQVSDANDSKPATTRLYMQGQNVNDRWWGNPAINLTDGDNTISIPIDESRWTGVGGGITQPPLKDIINNIANIGFTLGGQSFAGHGVYVTNGNKRFTLKSYTIT